MTAEPVIASEARHKEFVIASAARQSIVTCRKHGLPRFARNDEVWPRCARKDDALS
jgi:hypothetical protein